MVAGRLCVVATLSLLVADPLAAAAEPAIPGGRALVATVSVSPSTHLFGDTVRARLDVVFDPREFDPELLRVRLRFAPYEAVDGVGESRRTTGRLVHVRYEATLRCLHVGCLAPRAETLLGGQEEGRAERHTIQLPPAAILYGPPGEGELLVQRLFPSLQVVSRINTAQADSLHPDARPGSEGAFVASVDPPEPTYRTRPAVLAGLALAAASLLALFPLGLAVQAVGARRLAARRWRPLSPVERALVLVDWAARRVDGDEDRRKALEALAVVLEQHGDRPLAESTRIFAWAEEPPTRERANDLGTEARRAFEGRADGARIA